MNGAWLLWRGLAIGLAIAAPVGPIGLLCIQRTLQHGRRTGFVSGLGAAAADAVYGSVAAFGLTFLSTFLLQQRPWLAVGGGLFLVALGVRTYRQPPADLAPVAANAAGRPAGLAAAFATTFLLTLTNPVTILSFVAVFAGLGLGGGVSSGAAASLVLGVFAGSASWWLLLSGGVSLARRRLHGGALRWINRLAGLVIAGFGAAALAGAL